jgi:type III secretion protein X
MAIDILNPNLGFSGVLEPAADRPGLPEARPLPSSAIPESGLSILFNLSGVAQAIDRALTPEVPDPDLLRPDVFRRNLSNAFEALGKAKRSEIRRFVREDLAPMMEEADLYELVSCLLVSS